MTALTLQKIVSDSLADVGVKLAKRRFADKQRSTIWAQQLPGFGIRTYASGRQVYIVQTRMAGRLRTVTLCNVRLLSLAKAKDIARQILLRARSGQDPAGDRQQARRIPPFDAFLQEYWERMAPTWKASTLKTHNTYRRRYLDGAFGKRAVDQVTRADVALWFADVAEGAGRGGANRALDVLRTVFNKAEEWGIRPASTNPTVSIQRYGQMRFARFLRPEELRALGAALELEKARAPMHVAAIHLLLLTGCRRREITGLLWPEIVGARLKLTDTKTGPRTVWLGAEAQKLLHGLPRVEGRSHVFWNERSQKPLDIKNFWPAFCKRASFQGLRIHDLRHSFASHAAAMSETLPMIGQLLGHRSVQSTSRYAHLDDRDLQETTEDIGNLIHALCSAGLGAAPPALSAKGAGYVR
jgi:integrase